MTNILVFGASGPIGHFLLPELIARGDHVYAVSRQPVPTSAQHASITWLQADLDGEVTLSGETDTIYSLGPLDGFARWYERQTSNPARRVIAISSMSAQSKQQSLDSAEQALAHALCAAEDTLMRVAQGRGAACTLLRATLIYGAGVDRSLAPIARFAKRWRIFPIPIGANGMRQPVHAADLAWACVTVSECARAAGRTYALGGGERLSFADMLVRVRAGLPFRSVRVPVPVALLGALAPLAARLGIASVSRGAINRLREHLLADNTDAACDFGYAPRSFSGNDVLVDEAAE